MTDSYWLSEPAEQLPRVTCGGPVDVVVIGGGVTGCSCALTLAEAGLRVRLYEARRVASGASGRNGGFALRGLAISYPAARERFGSTAAEALWRFTERSLDRMETLAGDALRRVGSLRLADDEELAAVRAEYEALRGDGLSAEWVDELGSPLAATFRGAILHPGDGSLQPARWVRRLAARAAEAGVEIAEETRIESLEDLEAEHVVIATDGYTHGLLAELDRAIKPIRGQVIVTEPLAETLYPRPHYARHGFDYWQQTPDRRLVLGGRRDRSLETEFTNEESITEPIQAELETFAAELIGEEPRIEHRWPGIFGTTEDELPLVGRLPGRDRVWVSAGYSGHGNVLGLGCGELVAQAILGSPAPELQYFDPARVLYDEAV
ncbi:MAG: FAD-binding oxidoreductase [Actinobacteria bacterium]|nr:MAG: FAD-binding oxidoreductase [Actinomycetota bacterium]